ncbi:MAG: hypothetical protein ACI8QF_003961, partial [Limisphaerales bacterium]
MAQKKRRPNRIAASEIGWRPAYAAAVSGFFHVRFGAFTTMPFLIALA